MYRTAKPNRDTTARARVIDGTRTNHRSAPRTRGRWSDCTDALRDGDGQRIRRHVSRGGAR